ncbi:hypothetical protein [Spirosoma endophyticum]|nr:hypothetical protein [Spirosoma endophyticum]
MELVIKPYIPFTNSGTFRLGALLRFTEPIYQISPGTVGLVYESVQENGIDYCGVILENGMDIGLVMSCDLDYLAEKLLQIPTTYQFTTPAELMRHYKQGTFRKAFSLVYPPSSTVQV